MINLETLEGWLNAPVENERLEFKETKNQFDTIKLLKYCVALANEGGGHFILYHFSLFASQRMQVWQAFERGCLSWI